MSQSDKSSSPMSPAGHSSVVCLSGSSLRLAGSCGTAGADCCSTPWRANCGVLDRHGGDLQEHGILHTTWHTTWHTIWHTTWHTTWHPESEFLKRMDTRTHIRATFSRIWAKFCLERGTCKTGTFSYFGANRQSFFLFNFFYSYFSAQLCAKCNQAKF